MNLKNHAGVRRRSAARNRFRMNPEERITGPVLGYWVATFACPLGVEFVGGARVFQVKPRSFWDGGSVSEVFCTESVATGEDAHAAAVELTVRELRRLR